LIKLPVCDKHSGHDAYVWQTVAELEDEMPIKTIRVCDECGAEGCSRTVEFHYCMSKMVVLSTENRNGLDSNGFVLCRSCMLKFVAEMIEKGC
jgi:hypothetical protein